MHEFNILMDLRKTEGVITVYGYFDLIIDDQFQYD